MNVGDMSRKFECREDKHKTQTGTSCEKCNSKAFRLGIELASSGLPDQFSTTELGSRCRQLGREFSIYINEMVMPVKYNGILIIIIFGPGLDLIMYILTTLEFPTHNSDFHLFDNECKCQTLLLIYLIDKKLL